MEILYRLSIAEMAERGVLDAYYKLYTLTDALPAAMLVTLTQKQAEKIGLTLGSGSVEAMQAVKVKRARKAKG